MIQRRALLLTALVWPMVMTASSARSQGVQPVTCQLSFPSLAANDSHWIGALSAYANAKGLEKSLGDAYKDVVDRKLRSELQAMGGLGYLLEFHVLRSVGTEIADRQLLFVELHGVGANPEGALVSSVSRSRLLPAPPQGYENSEDDSYFIWLKRSGNSVSAGCISPPAAGELKSDAGIIVRSNELLADAIRLNNDTIYHELSLAAQVRASSRTLQARLAALESDRQAAEAGLAKINAELARAIDAERRGAGLQRTLAALQGALTVVQLVNLATATLNDPSTNFSGAKTPSDVVTITRQYTITAGDRARAVEKTVMIQDQELANATRAWIDGHLSQGVPSTIIPKKP